MILGALSWPLLLAILGATFALIVTLHLLRLRRRKVEVPHLALFEESLGSAAAARRVDWLRRLLALLLSLLIAGAIGLSLGEPELRERSDGEATILVIDQSLSMEAIDADGRSRRKRAVEVAKRRIEAKSRRDAMAIIAMDHVPIPLSGLIRDKDALLDALEIARTRTGAGWGSAAPREAMELARALLRDQPKASILLFTDDHEIAQKLQIEMAELEASEAEPRVDVITILDPAENLAIAELAARRLPSDPARVHTLIRIENHGPSERRARLNLSSSAGLIESRMLTLGPFANEQLYFDDLPLLDGRIDAELIAEDDLIEALSRDDKASVAVAPRARVRAHLMTEGNLYIEAALLLDPSIELTKSRPGEALPSGVEGGIDLYILDGVEAELPPRAAAIVFLDPRASSSILAETGRIIERPLIRTEREEDAIVRGARLYETNIKEARALRVERHERILARTANEPIIALLEREQRRMFVFGFRIEESDLPLRAAFPLLLMRGIDELLGREAVYQAPHRQYEAVELRTDAGALELKRIDNSPKAPNGSDARPRILRAAEGRARFIPSVPGVYHARPITDERAEGPIEKVQSAPTDVQEVVISRAAPDESAVYVELENADVDKLGRAFEAEDALEAAPRRAFTPSLLTLLLLGGLALLLAESALYHLRWIE